jgi:hypothetical protein
MRCIFQQFYIESFYSVVSGENSAASVVQCLFQQYYSKHLYRAALGQLCFMQYSAYFSISTLNHFIVLFLEQQRCFCSAVLLSAALQ